MDKSKEYKKAREKMMSSVKIIIGVGGAILSGIVATIGTFSIRQNYYGKDGYNAKGFDREGYDRRGYTQEGWDRDGYDRQGYDEKGLDRQGFGRDGYNDKDLDKDGYDRFGYNKLGFGKDGYTRDGFDEEGFDRSGYSKEGFDRNGKDRIGRNQEEREVVLKEINNEYEIASGYKKSDEISCRHAVFDCRRILERIVNTYINMKDINYLKEKRNFCERINYCKELAVFDEEECCKMHQARKKCNKLHPEGNVEKGIDRPMHSQDIETLLKITKEEIENFEKRVVSPCRC